MRIRAYFHVVPSRGGDAIPRRFAALPVRSFEEGRSVIPFAGHSAPLSSASPGSEKRTASIVRG